MGNLLKQPMKSGEPIAKIPAKFYNDLDEILTYLDVFNGSIQKTGNRWIIGIEPSSASSGVTDFRIYRKDMTLIEFTYAEIIANYDPATDTNWSVEFVVSNSLITGLADPMGVPTMDVGGEELYDGDASADPVETQDYYRLPIVRGEKVVCQGGVYRENIFCAGSRGPIVELVRIG